MKSATFWTSLVPGQPAISIFIWLVILVILMYVARKPAHQMILVATHGMRNGPRT